MSSTDTRKQDVATLQPAPKVAVGAQLLQLVRPWWARLLVVAAAVLGAAEIGRASCRERV